MIEQKLYVCEYCGTQYKEKSACKACETSHIKPVEIIDARYVAVKNDVTGYPTQIHVKMANGKVQIFRR